MPIDEPQLLVDLYPLCWTPERRAAALTAATPNNQRVAAAAERLSLEDNAAAFAAWCDSFASQTIPDEPQ